MLLIAYSLVCLFVCDFLISLVFVYLLVCCKPCGLSCLGVLFIVCLNIVYSMLYFKLSIEVGCCLLVFGLAGTCLFVFWICWLLYCRLVVLFGVWLSLITSDWLHYWFNSVVMIVWLCTLLCCFVWIAL